jgi:hypothetical protein
VVGERLTTPTSEVCIIAEYDDPDLARLTALLEGVGVEAHVFELGRPADEYDIVWDVGVPPVLIHAHQTLDATTMNRCESVLFKLSSIDERPLVTLKMEPESDRRFAIREWHSTLMNALQALLDVVGVPSYGSPLQALWHDWKPLLLGQARERTSIPQTQIATRFTDLWSSRHAFVAKAINANPTIDDQRYFPTVSLSSDLVAELALHRSPAPTLVQQRLDREREIRRFVFGPVVLRVELDASRDYLDIRYAPDLRIDAVTVEPTGSTGLGSFLADRGFTYCAVDSILDETGREWLTDVTPRGSWFWLEKENEPVVSQAVADVLVGRRALDA